MNQCKVLAPDEVAVPRLFLEQLLEYFNTCLQTMQQQCVTGDELEDTPELAIYRALMEHLKNVP